jgi:hypothetical protein
MVARQVLLPMVELHLIRLSQAHRPLQLRAVVEAVVEEHRLDLMVVLAAVAAVLLVVLVVLQAVTTQMQVEPVELLERLNAQAVAVVLRVLEQVVWLPVMVVLAKSLRILMQT